MKVVQIVMILMFFLQSCHSNDDQDIVGFNVDYNFQFHITDTLSNDLLNPDFKGSFKHSDISHYELNENGGKVSLALKDHLIVSSSGQAPKYYINIVAIGAKQPDGSYLSYVKLSDKVTDTIRVEIKEGKDSSVKNKIYYNNKLVWDTQHLKTLPFGITK